MRKEAMEAQLARLPLLRKDCAACAGNPGVCQTGDNLNRLPGCQAFTADGMVKPVTLAAMPGDKRQPWQVAA